MKRTTWNITDAAHFSDDKLKKLIREDSVYTDMAVRKLSDISKSCNPLILLGSVAKLYGAPALVLLYLQSLASSKEGFNLSAMDKSPKDRDVFQAVQYFRDMSERIRRLIDCRTVLRFRENGIDVPEKELSASAEELARRCFPFPQTSEEIRMINMENTELGNVFHAVAQHQDKINRIYESSTWLDEKDAYEMYNVRSYLPDLDEALIAPVSVEIGEGTMMFGSGADKGWLTIIPLEASLHPFISWKGSYYCFVAPFIGYLMETMAEAPKSGLPDMEEQKAMIETALAEEESALISDDDDNMYDEEIDIDSESFFPEDDSYSEYLCNQQDDNPSLFQPNLYLEDNPGESEDDEDEYIPMPEPEPAPEPAPVQEPAPEKKEKTYREIAEPEIRRIDFDSDKQEQELNFDDKVDTYPPMLEGIGRLMSGPAGEGFRHLIDTSTMKFREELENTLVQARDAILRDGRDKMFTISGTDITVVMCMKESDQLREIQHRTNVAAVMRNNNRNTWNEMDIFMNEDGIMTRVNHTKICRDDFSPAQWSRVTAMADQLMARHRQ